MNRIVCISIFLALGVLTGCEKAVPPETLLIESAQKIVANQMKDPQSVQFRNVEGSIKARLVCGEVNAKNTTGAYVGFRHFVVAGDVDAQSHSFTAGASHLIEPSEPTLRSKNSTGPMTSEGLNQLMSDLKSQQEYVKTLETIAECQRVVPQVKLIEASERKASESVLDKVMNLFSGESS